MCVLLGLRANKTCKCKHCTSEACNRRRKTKRKKKTDPASRHLAVAPHLTALPRNPKRGLEKRTLDWQARFNAACAAHCFVAEGRARKLRGKRHRYQRLVDFNSC